MSHRGDLWSSPRRRPPKRSDPVSRETALWARVATELGRPLNSGQTQSLETFGKWLTTEAVASGGIGPNETSRIDSRHLADALLFARFLDQPDQIWDLGSGVGLPGIPLAILLPGTRFVLIDRSAKRVDLINRAVRVLRLDNVESEIADITNLDGDVDVIVSRASLPPDQLTGPVMACLRPGGIAIVGGSWRSPPVVDGWVTEEVRLDALDRTVWFLMMRRQ